MISTSNKMNTREITKNGIENGILFKEKDVNPHSKGLLFLIPLFIDRNLDALRATSRITLRVTGHSINVKNLLIVILLSNWKLDVLNILKN